jgi:glycosyltransferase involved in cell wall biosynthesis
MGYLRTTDVYVSAYTDHTQSISGTLCMALGAGAAIVSTSYPFASEVLRGGAGVLVPHKNAAAICDAVAQLLSNDTLRIGYGSRAGRAAKQMRMRWDEVGRAYVRLARQIARAEGQRARGRPDGGESERGRPGGAAAI